MQLLRICSEKKIYDQAQGSSNERDICNTTCNTSKPNEKDWERNFADSLIPVNRNCLEVTNSLAGEKFLPEVRNLGCIGAANYGQENLCCQMIRASESERPDENHHRFNGPSPVPLQTFLQMPSISTLTHTLQSSQAKYALSDSRHSSPKRSPLYLADSVRTSSVSSEDLYSDKYIDQLFDLKKHQGVLESLNSSQVYAGTNQLDNVISSESLHGFFGCPPLEDQDRAHSLSAYRRRRLYP